MRSERYVHPEFGCLAPAPRLRRELRVGFFAMLFGMGVGALAVIAFSIDNRKPENASSGAATRGAVTAPASLATEAPAAAGTGKPRAMGAANDGPIIARLPLGGSAPSSGKVAAGARAEIAGRPLASGLSKPAPEHTTALTFPQNAATSERPNTNLLSNKKPHKIAGTQNPQREVPNDYRTRDERRNWMRPDEKRRAGGVDRPYARESSSSRNSFWAWSR